MATNENTAPAAAPQNGRSLPITLRTQASEVPAVIAGRVSLMRFSEALARAGLTGRHDADRGLLVIEPAQSEIPEDAELGMAWFNGLSRSERAHWLEVAGSARPVDAWRAFQAGMTLPD
ncbi:MAG: hypothetical protein ACP5P4_17105 [Steroidobacteraceae bacterium]